MHDVGAGPMFTGVRCEVCIVHTVTSCCQVTLHGGWRMVKGVRGFIHLVAITSVAAPMMMATTGRSECLCGDRVTHQTWPLITLVIAGMGVRS